MLQILQDFFAGLVSQDVRHCHWKSNAHLLAALAGETDLDLLIDQGQADRFRAVLKQFSFVQVRSAKDKSYPDLADYLGFDHQTGRLVHLHVHYRLVLGGRYNKIYRLPVEGDLLDSFRILAGVRVPSAEWELVLLLVRILLKYSWEDLLKKVLRPGYRLPADIERELSWLIESADQDVVADLLNHSCLEVLKEPVLEVLRRYGRNELTFTRLVMQKMRLTDRMKGFRYQHGTITIFRPWRQRFRSIMSLLHVGRPQGKAMEPAGVRIAFVGCDGSGKSTAVVEIEQWLAWKFSTVSFYLGIPKKSSSRLLLVAAAGLRRLRSLVYLPGVDRFLCWNVRYLTTAGWLGVARYRLAIARKGLSLANSGRIVLFDRYPLTQFDAMAYPMDRPRLVKELEKWNLGGRNGSREKEIYESMVPPDLVIVLNVDYETARERKRDTPDTLLAEKVAAIRGLPRDGIFRAIDGNRPLAEVLLAVKRVVWEFLLTWQKRNGK